MLGDDLGQRRLAGTGGAIEDDRAKPVGMQHPPQEFPLAQEMLLTDEFGQGPGPHPGGEGLRLPPGLGLLLVKQPRHDGHPGRDKKERRDLNPVRRRETGVNNNGPVNPGRCLN